MVKLRNILFLLLSLAALNLRAEIEDPFDPFDFRFPGAVETENDDDKNAEELIDDARFLLLDKRPLDARTKLLKALKKDPEDYQAHLLLSHYYSEHVGHFRLALKYTKQAQALFQKRWGPPPYTDFKLQNDHARLLYSLAQGRLNLDNYAGALEVLDEFSGYYTYAEWYHGTRAWILMKLGRLDEAIRVARLGVLLGSEPGRVLNMLGILLSMSGEREASLQVFRDAINYEIALGSGIGQPATPLNNSGEVFKEIFQEEKAEAAWLRATRLPDGCEHILPSLNLALLYVDQLNFSAAGKTLDNFNSCVAQFPLRNGEEHRALEQLARGRLDLHAGKLDSAISRFTEAQERRQWFGKIGTNENDLKAATLISMAQALRRKNNRESFYRYDSALRWSEAKFIQARRAVHAWWLMRRARQMFLDDLNDLEDLFIRSTDSLIEYPTFGEVLADLPTAALKSRIDNEKDHDKRREAKVYYQAYLAENLMEHGEAARAEALLNQIISSTRSGADDLLRLHVLLLRLRALNPGSSSYERVALEVFSLARAALMNAGLPLPVGIAASSSVPEVTDALDGSAFLVQDGANMQFQIRYDFERGEHILSFVDSNTRIGTITVRSGSLKEAVNKLSEEVFTG